MDGFVARLHTIMTAERGSPIYIILEYLTFSLIYV